MRRSILICSALGLLGVACAIQPTPASAGLFDFLFGPPPPAYRPPSANPISVTVRPKKDRRRNEAKKRLGKKVMVASVDHTGETKHQRVASMNPEAIPDWHLKDTTLRAGDILILKSGPVVFEGFSTGRHVQTEFASLDQTRLLSRSGQREILKMVAGISVLPDKPPAAVAPAKKAGRQAALGAR